MIIVGWTISQNVVVIFIIIIIVVIIVERNVNIGVSWLHHWQSGKCSRFFNDLICFRFYTLSSFMTVWVWIIKRISIWNVVSEQKTWNKIFWFDFNKTTSLSDDIPAMKAILRTSNDMKKFASNNWIPSSSTVFKFVFSSKELFIVGW